MSTTRRSLLRIGMRSVTALGAANILKSTAFAASAHGSDLATVAIHLIGGNDSNNLIAPVSGSEYAAYARGRGELAIPQSALLNISASRQAGSYGFHPAMPGLRRLYDQGAVAVVANVGSLRAPLNRGTVLAGQGLPADLGSHISESRWHFARSGFMAPPWAEALQQPFDEQNPREIYAFSSGLLMIPAERARIEGAEFDNKKLVEGMRNAAPLGTGFPQTGLGLQLWQAARLLQISEKFGISHPMFAATLGGFDTHLNQLPLHAALLQSLSEAMSAFYEATHELGIASRVTTYTDTEFNRALAPNKTHGSDHGWGGHQLVMGGGIRGGDIHGQMPSFELGGESDAGSRGVWIPTTSTHNYQATFARRFGLQPEEFSRTVPSATSVVDL